MEEWFVSVAGQTTGPHPAEHVVHWVRTGQVPPTAGFCPTNGAGWLPLAAAWPQLAGPGATPAPMMPASLAFAAELPVLGDTTQVGIRPSAAIEEAPFSGDQPQVDQTPVPGRAGVHLLTDLLADFAGVERLEGFRLHDLLSAVFHRYGREEVELRFATGLPGFTPQLEDIEPGWPKPWMFVRLFLGTAILFLGFLLLTEVFGNDNMLPGMIVLGSFAVPMSTMVFFFELNSARNVSLYLMIYCMLVGSLISLAVALPFAELTDLVGPYAQPVLIGVVEELAKLLALFVITLHLPGARYPWILNGVLFGAAIGAGFACFESAGYAFRFLVAEDGLDLQAATSVILIRGLLAPFGHVVWTALAAGALWRVKLDRTLSLRMLVHRRVVKMVIMVIILHALWDFTLVDPPFLVKYLGLGVIAWWLAFGMLEAGLKQIKAAQVSARDGQLEVSGSTVVLRTRGR